VSTGSEYPPRKWASRAIKAFLRHFAGEYALLHVGAQVIVRKTLTRAAIAKAAG
jgi:hypothetical protein